MNIKYPFQFNNTGNTAIAVTTEAHIRDLIEQVLFTAPGERVNNPSFGCGLLQMVFEPNSHELEAATQFLVQGSLQQWLGNIIEVKDVQVIAEDSKLNVTIVYLIRATMQQLVAQFSR